jgi:arsenite-transporting ATPase
MDAAFSLKERRVLLTSIDPAHSLGDALGRILGDSPVHVRGTPSNLLVREMDAGRVFAAVREKYSGAIDRLFDRIGGGSFDAAHDRAVMQGLIDLAPPGIDELAAIIEITEALSPGMTDLVVLDTAPTGHALRLLEMPALIHDWTRALMAILLKYQPITGVGDLGALLLTLSQGLGRLRQLLSDRTRTGFVLVTRAASLPRLESKRLLAALARLSIHVPAVIVNAVGRDRCIRCRRAAARERREIASLDRIVSAPERSLVLAATSVPPPRTGGVLLEWRRRGWRYHQNA